MTATLRLQSSLAALLVTLAFGCSSTSSSAPAAGTDAQTADAAAEGGDEEDADEMDGAVADTPLDTPPPVDTSPPRDTGSTPDTRPANDTSVADTTTACHGLVDSSSGVTLTFSESTPPTAAGGQPMPGVYVLTSAVQYGGSYIAKGMYGTLKISTSSIDRSVQSVRTTDGYSASGDSIYLFPQCGRTGPTTTLKYTATSTKYVEYVPQFGGTQVLTYSLPQ